MENDLDPRMEKLKSLMGLTVTLRSEIRDLAASIDDNPPSSFGDFSNLRDKHMKAQWLIRTIEEMATDLDGILPAKFQKWIITAKMKAFATFAEIANKFLSEPPETFSKSLSAKELLESELAHTAGAIEFFNESISSISADESMTEAINKTLDTINNNATIIKNMLESSVEYLPEF